MFRRERIISTSRANCGTYLAVARKRYRASQSIESASIVVVFTCAAQVIRTRHPRRLLRLSIEAFRTWAGYVVDFSRCDRADRRCAV